jgi:hypothetical protein
MFAIDLVLRLADRSESSQVESTAQELSAPACIAKEGISRATALICMAAVAEYNACTGSAAAFHIRKG